MADENNAALTVYFDGSCPLCAAEIAYYRRHDAAGAICFLDVSREGVLMGDDLTRERAMEKFHVRASDGALVSGAAAFVRLWDELPRWRWAASLAKSSAMLSTLEMAYGKFLRIRPFLSKAALWLKNNRAGSSAKS